MKHIVVFSGAGVSAESGLKTFRDSGGLWEEYDVMEVATPEAWAKDPEMVLDFYNQRRDQIINSTPNDAHRAIASLEDNFKVTVVTQNIDDLHERAGSTSVLHLHGLITKARSTYPPFKLFDIGNKPLKLGDLCDQGFQLRPHVVWFGEEVPNMVNAQEVISKADILIVVGTSLNVYPAAGLIHSCNFKCKKYLIDPQDVRVPDVDNLSFIKEKASTGMARLAEDLLATS